MLAAPIYFTSPVDAARLPTIYRCRGVCQGVAVVGDDLLVLEADDQTGRVIRRDSSGAVHLVAGGLPHPGEGVRVGPRGDLFFPSDEGILRIGPHGHVVSVLSRLSARARVNVDPHGNLLVTEPNSGVVVRLHTPIEPR